MSAKNQKTDNKNQSQRPENKPIKKSGVLSGVLDLILQEQNYPFELFAHKTNPFLDMSKRLAYTELITIISEYGDLCADDKVWNFGEKQIMKENLELLDLKRRKVNTILRALTPKNSIRSRKSSMIRMLEFVPHILVQIVEVCKHAMKLYDQKSKNKIKGQTGQYKNRALKEFWEHTFKNNPYPNWKKWNHASYTTIAIGFVSYFTGCRDTTLKEIYYKVDIKEREKIANEVVSNTIHAK